MVSCPYFKKCSVRSYLNTYHEKRYFKFCVNGFKTCARFKLENSMYVHKIESCCRGDCIHNQNRAQNPYIHPFLMPEGFYLGYDRHGQNKFAEISKVLKELKGVQNG